MGWYTGPSRFLTGGTAMAGISRKPWITPQDYLAAERSAELRHEYVDGEIFAMVGRAAGMRPSSATCSSLCGRLPAPAVAKLTSMM